MCFDISKFSYFKVRICFVVIGSNIFKNSVIFKSFRLSRGLKIRGF